MQWLTKERLMLEVRVEELIEDYAKHYGVAETEAAKIMRSDLFDFIKFREAVRNEVLSDNPG